MLASWDSLNPQIQSAMIIGGVTFLAAFVGFVAVIVQIGRQARAAIRQNRDNEAMKLKLRVYEQIRQTCEAVMNASGDLSNYLRTYSIQVAAARPMHRAGLAFTVPGARIPELVKKDAEVNLAAIRIITAIEQWQIIDPRIDVFQTAINAALHDLRAVFHGAFFPVAMRSLPIEPPNAPVRTLPWLPPPGNVHAEFERLAGNVIQALDAIGLYASDFQREMQNLLLGGLFARKLRAREPIDQRLFAISLARRNELMRHFETATPWGETKTQTEAAVKAALANRDSDARAEAS